MATIEKFEDLEIWQLAKQLCKQIESYISTGSFNNNFGLINQIRNSSGSAMDNIAEGFERGGKAEFIQFLSIAKGSAGEVRSQLHRALDFGYISQSQFEESYNLTETIAKKINRFVSYLNKSEYRGEKFKERI